MSGDVLGVPLTAPPLALPVTFDQYWADLVFLHWPVDPDAVHRFFPAGTRPDVFADGMTYVALVPFVMRHTRIGTRLPLGHFGGFAETNVRLYSVDDAGRHGVLFRSLETERLAVVPATRGALGIPYTWARMRVERDGRRITYTSSRRWPRRGLRSALTVEVADAITPTPLETWLTARWGAHTRKAGRTWWLPNEHDTWPLHGARVVDLSDDLVAAAGVTPAGPPLRALYSPGVHTRFGRPTRVTRAGLSPVAPP